MEWRNMRPADLAMVVRIAEVVHPGFPERPEVLAERLALCPGGCLVLEAPGGRGLEAQGTRGLEAQGEGALEAPAKGMLDAPGTGVLEAPGGLARDGAGGVVGYVISHPWAAGAAPKLDSLLGALPAAPGCWYWHDLALLPVARGRGAAAAAVQRVLGLARGAGLDQVALVAVGESGGFWRRMGFVPAEGPEVASYGTGAAYMVREWKWKPLR
jgi:GNAT superfamily N-acetyltransferase